MLKFKKMGSDKVPLLLVTANVGSIFEDPSGMLPIWTSEFLQAVSRMDPKFIALHLQEVGGKAYEKSMQYVQDFVQRLCDCPELRIFDKIRIFLDEDFSSPEKFTALGNMYFAHTSLTDLKIWDFELNNFVEVQGKEINSGNIEKVTTKEKAKFPQNFFPECKWSRKGFLRTRWMIRGTALEFVNIHLFHDASNLLAMEPYPSVYCRSRRRALRHTLKHLHSDVNAAPYFIFGDFNFRTDTGGVVKKVTEELTACRLQNGAHTDSTKLQYKSVSDERLVLTIGKKEFAHQDHQKVFREPWLQRYDRELEALKPHLYEFPVKFPPTYPFEEDPQLPTHFMKTRGFDVTIFDKSGRCPAWCDRILLSQTARLLIQQDACRQAENRHLHTSRKSVAESTDSSSRASSSDSSPARSASPARQVPPQGSPVKTLEKKSSVLDLDALSVPGISVSRKSIADPTSVQQAINARTSDAEPGMRRKLVRNQSEGSPKPEGGISELRRLVDAPRKRADYGVIGDTACMGDHKPVYLRVMLQSERGIVPCCSTSPFCPLCASAAFLPSTLSLHPHRPISRLPTDPDLLAKKAKNDKIIDIHSSQPDKLVSENFIKRTRTGSLNEIIFRIPYVEITTAGYASDADIFVNDIDTSLLSAKPCLDPYTPESVDSHTPNVEGTSTGSDDLSTEIADIMGKGKIEPRTIFKLTRDRSVSPTQLKSRLDMLLSDDSRKKTKDIPELQRLNSRESCKSGNSKAGGLCCLALKCYGFCRRRARKVDCRSCRSGTSKCCTS